MPPVGSRAEKLIMLFAELAVCGIWVWLAIWTTRGLRVITRNTAPFTKRTIWFTKILAVVVGAGGVLGTFTDLGLPWYLSALPAAAVVFFALRERVENIVVPTPPQSEAAYRASWDQYRHFRTIASWSWIGFGVAFAGAIPATIFQQSLFGFVKALVLVTVPMIFVGALAGIHYSEWKLLRWPCPRCGKSFRGFWPMLWMPKRCRYCGLPRWEENPGHNESLT